MGRLLNLISRKKKKKENTFSGYDGLLDSELNNNNSLYLTQLINSY